MTFLDKLVALLSKGKLPPQYNIVPFLSVHDPEADVKSKAQAYVSFALRAMPKGKSCNTYRKGRRPSLLYPQVHVWLGLSRHSSGCFT